MIREGSPGSTSTLLRWEGFVEKVDFEPGVMGKIIIFLNLQVSFTNLYQTLMG